MGNLVVSEKFYSIQGEGQTMGVPSIFLRLSGCNILCKSEHWVCDSIEVWKKGTKTAFKDVFTSNDIERLRLGAHLVITGGEPLLHQKKVQEFITWFIEEYFIPIIEIETNGTITPNSYLQNVIKYWNCSPKLQNSGVAVKKRINLEAIRTINAQENSIFKFVINKDIDLCDIIDDYGSEIDREKIVLMPAGESREQLEKTRSLVVECCLAYNFRYSERLHIVIWNKKTGV